MKRLMMAVVAAGSMAFAVPVLAQTAMPRDTGGTPGNGQSVISGERDTGGSPGNGQSAISGEKDTGGSPGNGQAVTSGEKENGAAPTKGTTEEEKSKD